MKRSETPERGTHPRALWIGLAALVVGSVSAPAGAVVRVDEVQLLVFDNQVDGVSTGWTFQVELDGDDLNVVTLTPPGRQAINLSGDSSERRFQSDPYASFGELQMDFPASGPDYQIEINGAITLSFPFAPVPANGSGIYLSPPHESATTDVTPTLLVDNGACTNCNVQVVNLEAFAGTIDSELFEFRPFSSTIEISDLDPPLAALPIDNYETCLSLAVGSIEEDFVSGGQIFQLVRAAVDENCVEFDVVPAPQVDAVEMSAGEQRDTGVVRGWYYEVTVFGDDLLQGTVAPPGGAPIDLDNSFGGELSLLSGPFASAEALFAAFPPSNGGQYVISLNGGVATVNLDFDPVLPDGVITVTSPSPGESVGSRPSFVVSNDCTNCTGQYAVVLDENTSGAIVAIEYDVGSPFPSRISYSDFGPNQGLGGSVEDGLPQGAYVFIAEAYNETATGQSFTPPDSFDYFASGYRDDAIPFTVPEPGAVLLQLSALLGIGTHAWRRRTGSGGKSPAERRSREASGARAHRLPRRRRRILPRPRARAGGFPWTLGARRG